VIGRASLKVVVIPTSTWHLTWPTCTHVVENVEIKPKHLNVSAIVSYLNSIALDEKLRPVAFWRARLMTVPAFPPARKLVALEELFRDAKDVL
jgi:hypothetical protein